MKRKEFEVKVVCGACMTPMRFLFKPVKRLISETTVRVCTICTHENTVTVNYK